MQRRFILTTGRVFLALVASALVASPARAQIRVVTYNTLDGPANSSAFPAWNTVLQAIGNQSVNGVAKRIGIMALEEVTTNGASAQNIANLLNGLYGVSSYHAATAPFGDGFNLQSLVYDDSQVQLLDTFALDIGTRPTWRGHFRPVGYTNNSAAEFYVYASHLKAFSGFESTRASEAQALRNNGNSLGVSANIIYAGDYNLTSGAAEQAYANMLASGNGQAIDPQNGDFTDPLKKSYSSSSTDPGSRLDFQFITTELEDDEGLDLIDGNYRVFGREYIPGTSRLVTSPTELTSTSDHLPVVADYQLPAVLSAIASSIPATLHVGDVFNLNLTISNAANVVAAIGADELDYSITTIVGGALKNFSSFNQMDMALGGGNVYQIALDTMTAGMKTDMITVASGSPGVQTAMIQIPVSYSVLPSILYGDYNSDGTVDAADYTAWRDQFGSLVTLPNEDPSVTPGSVTTEDYDVWNAHFGQSLSGAGALATAPEPGSCVLVLIGICLLRPRSARVQED